MAGGSKIHLPSPEMKDEKVYKILEPELTKINTEFVAMETGEKSAFVKITLEILDELIKKMKESSKLFEWLFNTRMYVGSYFDGLRVKSATEFDINVVLKLPLVYEKIKIKRTPQYPGFVQVNFKEAKYSGDKLAKHQNETDEIFKWVNQDGYLSHRAVLQWWESVFSKIKDLTSLSLVVANSEYKITNFKKSGPAMTAHISGKNVDIDIDLVPVIQFSETIPPPSPIRWKDHEGKWYIVPKPMDDNELLWRLSFPEQEQKVMVGLNKLKMVNRFLKRVRDVHNWRTLLSSYYIKTIFLWEAHDRRIKKDEAFFNKNLGFLFVYFLKRLQGYLEQGNLPFFWDKDMNLFVNIKRVSLDGFACRIKRVNGQIEKFIMDKEVDKLLKLIGTLFNESCPSGKATESIGPLIDFDATPDSCEPSSSSHLPMDLFGPSPSADLLLELSPEPSPPSDHSTTSEDVQDSAIFSTVSSSSNGFIQNISYLEMSKEKSSLELEECRLRLEIARIDLKTALMNLKAAEKRHEKANLELSMLSKTNDSG